MSFWRVSGLTVAWQTSGQLWRGCHVLPLQATRAPCFMVLNGVMFATNSPTFFLRYKYGVYVQTHTLKEIASSTGRHCRCDRESKEEGGRVMGSKCAHLNLGQSGRSTSPLYFYPSVVQCYSDVDKTLFTHASASLFTAEGWRFFHLSVSHICLSQSGVSLVCRCHPVSISAFLASFPLASCVPVQLPIQYIRLRGIACLCGLFFLTHIHTSTFSLTHTKFTQVCLQCILPLSWV